MGASKSRGAEWDGDERAPVRPAHVPPHDHFFEDGEEPPHRYDLDDDLEYFLPQDFTLKPAEWRAVAREHLDHRWGKLIRYSALYLCLFVAGYMCVGSPYLIFFDPILLAGMTVLSLNQLTGHNWYGGFFSGFKRYGRLLVVSLPLTVATILALGCTALAIAVLDQTTARSLYLIPVCSLVLGLMLMLFINIRLCCFAQHLVIDQNLGAIEAMRGCWYLSRNHFWGLLWLRLKLHGLLVLYGVLTLGIGLIFVMPYTNLVWTAAYLDILKRYPAPEAEPEEEGEEVLGG